MAETRGIPVLILGGRGYVAGELLRLLAAHPVFRVAGVMSTSQAGEPMAAAFPHLTGVLPESLRFADRDALLAAPVRHVFGSGTTVLDAHAPGIGVFAATPHGETAALLDAVLTALEGAGFAPRAVDLSADFRFADVKQYESIYGVPHGAPARAGSFTCAVPEHHEGPVPRHAAQPGCFTTAAVLAAWPFVAEGLVGGPLFVSAITGSSGSGRNPAANTHHPERRSTVYAYAPLAHRHEAEMRMLLAAARGAAGSSSAIRSNTPGPDGHAASGAAMPPGGAARGAEPEVEFVPHSGPFVRGIHATVRIPLAREATAESLTAMVNARYERAPFVSASTAPPRLNDVVGTNRCLLGVAARGRTAVVTSVLDNLVKGASGGAVQWMNRLFDLPDDCGLRAAGLGVY